MLLLNVSQKLKYFYKNDILLTLEYNFIYQHYYIVYLFITLKDLSLFLHIRYIRYIRFVIYY